MYVNTQEQKQQRKDEQKRPCVNIAWMVGWLDGWMNFGIFLHVHHLAAECQNASHKHVRWWRHKAGKGKGEREMWALDSWILVPALQS